MASAAIVPIQLLANNANQVGSKTYTLSSSPAKGSTVVVLFGANSSKQITTISDDGSNTWNTAINKIDASTRTACIAVMEKVVTVPTTISITFSSATSDGVRIWVLEIPQTLGIGCEDRNISAFAGGTTSASTGASSTLQNPFEMALCVCNWAQSSGTTPSAGSGWTGVTTAAQGTNYCEYQLTTSNAAITGTCGGTVSTNYMILAVTIRLNGGRMFDFIT